MSADFIKQAVADAHAIQLAGVSAGQEIARRESAARIRALEAENERLRHEVEQLGQIADVCTFNALGVVCGYCRCRRGVKVAA